MTNKEVEKNIIYPTAVYQKSWNLYSEDMKPEDILVYEYVFFTVRKTRKRYLDISMQDIMRTTRLSRRYVEKGMQTLKTLGILEGEEILTKFGLKYFFNLRALITQIDNTHDFNRGFDTEDEASFYKQDYINWLIDTFGDPDTPKDNHSGHFPLFYDNNAKSETVSENSKAGAEKLEVSNVSDSIIL